MANKQYSNANPAGPDNKGGNDGMPEKGQALPQGAPSFKEGENPNASMPKLPQIGGAKE